MKSLKLGIIIFIISLFSNSVSFAQSFAWNPVLKKNINKDSLYTIWLNGFVVISNFNYNISDKDYKDAGVAKKKDLNKFILEQKSLLKTAKDSSDILLNIANAYMKLLNFEEAQKNYIAAGKQIQRKIDSPEASAADHRQGGMFSLYVSGDIAGAEISFTKALKINPNDTLSLNSMVIIRLQKGDTIGAQRLLDSALMRIPGSPTMLLTSNIVWIYKLMNLSDDSLRKTCLTHLPLEDFLKADFSNLKFEEQLVLNQVLQYRLIFKMMAIAEGTEEKKLLPCDIEKNKEIRRFYLAHEKQVGMKPYTMPQAIAWTYLAGQKYDSAIYYFNQAIKKNAAYGSDFSSTTSDMLYAISASNLYKKDTMASIATINRKIRMQDTIGVQMDDYILLAKMYAAKNDNKNAEWNVKIALQRDPGTISAYRMMTWLLSKSKNLSMAEQYAQGAIEAGKMNFETYVSNGFLYLVNNDPKKALQQFEAAWYLKKDNKDLESILNTYFEKKN